MKAGSLLLCLFLLGACGDEPRKPGPQDRTETASGGHARPELILARVAEGWRGEVRAAASGADAVRSIEVRDGTGASLGRIDGTGPLVFDVAAPPALLVTRVVWQSGHEREDETRP